MAELCQECDLIKAVKYCSSCDQRLCLECDLRIHNKGKRALHIRGDLEDKKKDYLLASENRLKLVQSEVYSHGELRVTVFQKICLTEEFGHKELMSLQAVAGDFYIQEAYRGNLMHEYEDFKQSLYDKFVLERGTYSRVDFEDLFEEFKNMSFIHVTVRKFGDTKPLKYVSILLTSLSIEAIVWILLSIKNDKMKPTDKLVLSRFKEYFLLKVSQKDWNAAMDYFYENPEKLNPTALLPKICLVDEKETSSKKKELTLIKSEGDTNKDEKLTSAYHFEVKNDLWEYEDVAELDEKDEEDWANFKRFIDNFFGEEVPFSPNDSRSKLKKQKNTRNIQKWLSSVENDLSKPTSSLSANHSLQKILTEQSISRAIPGGKYGCALMIKLTGPEELQPLSLGKLCSFVQKALNQNILIYYKTLLIRNNQFDAASANANTEAKNTKRIEILKEQILALLKENKSGLSLAQIPLLLKNKYKKTYNIQSLGFPKLKNLLVTMDEVDLEKTQGNLLKAVLKTHGRKNSEKPLEEPAKNNLGGKKFLTLRNKPLDNKLNNMHYSHLHAGIFSSDSAPPAKGYRTVSTLDDYIFKIQSTILDILNQQQNIFGIEVDQLKSELDKRLGTDFYYPIARVDSFQEFLITYLGDYLDIEIKKSIKSAKHSGPLSHIVYPKNYKLPTPAKGYVPQSFGQGYEQISNVSASSYQPYQSPDHSFANHFHPFFTERAQAEEQPPKLSQSFNVGGRSFDGRAETFSQQAGSSGGGDIHQNFSAKSTRLVNEYSHFGKLTSARPPKIFGTEFKTHGGMKNKDGPKYNRQKTQPVDEQIKMPDQGETISFEKDELKGPVKKETLAGSKSTEQNDEISDDPSFKLVEMLLDED